MSLEGNPVMFKEKGQAKRGPAQQIPAEYDGQWVAWDRNQTRIIANGHTFDEVKRKAAEAGESFVILAKDMSHENRFRFCHHAVYMVAVFLAQPT